MIQRNPRVTPVLFTVRQIANKLSCSERTVWRYIDSGMLASVKIGHSVRINKIDLLRLMKEGLKLPDNYMEISTEKQKLREQERIKRNEEYNKSKGGENIK